MWSKFNFINPAVQCSGQHLEFGSSSENAQRAESVVDIGHLRDACRRELNGSADLSRSRSDGNRFEACIVGCFQGESLYK